MDMSQHLNTIRRYSALIGELRDISQDEEAQALADREELGQAYHPEEGSSLAKAALALRFLHEVARIPLFEARICIAVLIQRQRGYCTEGKNINDIATQVARESGNVLIAEATALLFIEAAEGTSCEQAWRDVLHILRFGQVVDGEDDSAVDRVLH